MPIGGTMPVFSAASAFFPEAAEVLMRGTMMDFPLTLPTLLERADKLFSRVEILSSRPDRSLNRTCYGNFYRRARRLASALTKLGIRPGDRVAIEVAVAGAVEGAVGAAGEDFDTGEQLVGTLEERGEGQGKVHHGAAHENLSGLW